MNIWSRSTIAIKIDSFLFDDFLHLLIIYLFSFLCRDLNESLKEISEKFDLSILRE